MKYFVVTTKHHEGFCLWDSKLTDYKAPTRPAGRDLLRPMVDAFRERDFKVGLLPLADRLAPSALSHRPAHRPAYRNDPRAELMNASRGSGKYASYLHGQVRELLTRFRHDRHAVAGFQLSQGRRHWQGSRRLGFANLYRLIRELQPHIVLNDRLDLHQGWDVKTPEQMQPREWVRVNGQPVAWEACQTFSGVLGLSSR